MKKWKVPMNKKINIDSEITQAQTDYIHNDGVFNFFRISFKNIYAVAAGIVLIVLVNKKRN